MKIGIGKVILDSLFFLFGLFSKAIRLYQKNKDIIGTSGLVFKLLWARVNVPDNLKKTYEFITDNALAIKDYLIEAPELSAIRQALIDCKSEDDRAAFDCIVTTTKNHYISKPLELWTLLRQITAAVTSVTNSKLSKPLDLSRVEIETMAQKAYNEYAEVEQGVEVKLLAQEAQSYKDFFEYE